MDGPGDPDWFTTQAREGRSVKHLESIVTDSKEHLPIVNINDAKKQDFSRILANVEPLLFTKLQPSGHHNKTFSSMQRDVQMVSHGRFYHFPLTCVGSRRAD